METYPSSLHKRKDSFRTVGTSGTPYAKATVASSPLGIVVPIIILISFVICRISDEQAMIRV